MDWWDVVTDTFESVGEANVPIVGLLANIRRFPEDPAASISNVVSMYAPPVTMAMAMKAAITGEPNVGGAGSTPIIAAGLSTLKEMLEQCGSGEPDQGEELKRGADRFRALQQDITQAGSPASWKGAASNSYAFKNAHQAIRAQVISSADATISEILAAEAGQVASTRNSINLAIRYLNACIPVAISLGALPEGGTLASYGYQVRVVAEAVPPAALSFALMSAGAQANAARIKSAAAGYMTAGNASPPSPGGRTDRLAVDTEDLRHSAGKQQALASMIEQATAEPVETPNKVTQSHGTVCADTAVATSFAMLNRVKASEAMQAESLKLGKGLEAAADLYEAVDRHWQSQLDRVVRTR